jgi:MFS family permease
MLFMGVASTTWNIVTVSLRQRLIPEDLFGRVNSVYRFIGTGSIALGSLAGGFIAHSFGLRAPYLTGSFVAGLALVLGGAKLVRYMVPAVTPAPPSIT